MSDTTKYVAEALRVLDQVTSEASLLGWSDQFTNTTEYAYELTPAEVRTLEDAYDRKVRQFMPAGLGG